MFVYDGAQGAHRRIFILYCAVLYFSFVIYISVKTAICDGGKGTVSVDTLALKCSDLQMSPGFKLKEEDPAVFVADDREHFNPKRQWPKIPLPKVPATSSEELPVYPPLIQQS